MLYPNENNYDAIILQAAGLNSVPVALMKAVFANETAFGIHAVGDNGNAHGIGQMWLSTARGLGYAGPAGNPVGGTGLYDPRIAIPLTAKYLAQQLRRYNGNIAAALIAYNAGHSMIPAGGSPEAITNTGNREYVRKGVIHYNLYSGALSVADAVHALRSGLWMRVAVLGAGALGIVLIAALGLLLFAVWRR